MKTKSLQESLGAIEAHIFLGQSAVGRVKEMPSLVRTSGRGVMNHNVARIEQCFARIEELLEELEENAKK
tara:strand:+ start:232 stop:441 length:210 start_codon:yes stop_codon:yes gene_type:complete